MQVARDRAYLNKVHMTDRQHAWQDEPSDSFGVSEPQPPALHFSQPPRPCSLPELQS